MGASISDLVEGTYELTVTDQNGCIKTASTEVAGIECSVISILLNVEEITMVDGSDGLISTPVNDGYTYLWSTGATTATISDLSIGTYSVTVTDEKGCTGTQTAVLNGVSCTPFSIVLNTEDVIEMDGADGSISVSTGNEQDTYLWSNGETTATISNLPVGTYSVTVTDERGCTDTQTAVLNRIDCTPFGLEFFIEQREDGSIQDISTFIDGAEGTFSFLWSTGDTTANISGLLAGIYSVTATDENGCSATETVELFDCSLVNVGFDVILASCGEANGRISATGDSSVSYNWSTGSTDSEISNLSAGIPYSVTITNGPECSNISTFQVGQENDTTPPIINCPEDMVITNACNLPVTYDLVTSDDCNVTELELLQGLESGIEFPQGETLVEYMAKDAAGNSATCSFMVNQSSDMSLEYDSTFLIQDFGDQIILFAFDLKCSNPNEAITDFISVNGGVPPFTFDVVEGSNGGSATIYFVNVTDATGCLLQEQVNFLNIDETAGLISPILEISVQDASNGADGGIEVEIDDRFGIVSYKWTKDDVVVSTNQNLENVEAGSYVLELTDQFGCTYISDYEIQMLTTTSTNQLLLEETVQLMPNPNTGNFQIRITLPNPVSVSIELYDVNGRLLQPAIQRDNSDLPIDINMTDFSKGIYFTKISAEQEVIVKRVVLL